MTFNPHDYKELFPEGLFEFEKAPIKTWADSHRLFALNATPFKEESFTIADGLEVKTGNIKQAGGFSNYMVFEVDPKLRKVRLEFFQDKALFPIEIFNQLKNPLMITNAGYFYLTDDEARDPVKPPAIRVGNMVAFKGMLVNPPILDRSSIVVYKGGSIDLLFLKAKGVIEVDGNKFSWVGSKTETNDEDFVVYNSSNIEIGVVNDPVMGPSRRAQKVYIKPHPDKQLFVCIRKENYFEVIEITDKKVLINDKDLVLEGSQDLNVKVGARIIFKTVDSLNIDLVETAVSVGPTIYSDYPKTKKQVDIEFSISDMANPNNPHEESKKLARGALIKLKNGKIASVLVDGIPQAGDIYPGVTLKEFISFINSLYPDYVSAVATDPSSSMKVVYNRDGKVEIFGNLHYLAHRTDESGKIVFWPNGVNGRKLNSVLAVY